MCVFTTVIQLPVENFLIQTFFDYNSFMMKITFLGTGTSQGIPIIGSDHPVCKSKNTKDRRLRSSVLINWDKNN